MTKSRKKRNPENDPNEHLRLYHHPMRMRGAELDWSKEAFNWQIFEELCKIMCTQEEISAVMGLSHDTLQRAVEFRYCRRFKDVMKDLQAGGRASLRRNQFKLSETNAAMAIWLGKQYLGQTEKIEQIEQHGTLEEKYQLFLDMLDEIQDKFNTDSMSVSKDR